MTQLLFRLAIGKHDPNSRAARTRIGNLSALVGVALNLLLFAAKLIIGTVSASLSITADALNNLSDASGSIITFLGFKLAERPADKDHPYGHARFEYLSGLAVSALILLIGYELAKSAVDKIFHPAPVALSLPVWLVLTLSICAKGWLSHFNFALGRQIGSLTLKAAAQDSRNDMIATAAVLLAALIETLLNLPVDGFFGLGVAIFIFISGIRMAKETISPLLGENTDPALAQEIAQTVLSHPSVLGYHDLMVHDYGPGQKFGSLHVEMSHRDDPLLCHNIIDDLERKCLSEHGVHLVIHYDPVVTDDPQVEMLRECVRCTLQHIDLRLSLHDFRVVTGPAHTNLIFDIELPEDLSGKEAQIHAQIDAALSNLNAGKYYTVITFDRAAFN